MAKPLKGSSSLRKYRMSEAGGYYFVTTSCFENKPLFNSDREFSILFQSLDWMEAQNKWEWLCFICMPNHIHIVFILGENSDLSQTMKSYKSFTGKKLKQALEIGHPVWQEQYYDRQIRNE